MKLILAVVVAVVCVSVAAAQDDYKCTTPPEWYADFMEFNPSRGEERRGRIFYDEGNERVATREEKRTGPPPGNTTNYWEIFLHKEGVGYYIDEQTKECKTFSLSEPFPIIGPYLSDSFLGEYEIGSSAQEKDGVEVAVYSGTNDRGEFVGVWIPVDETTCIPVSETFTRKSDRSFSSRRYYNVRLGIFDLNVFIPPDYCS